MGRRTTSESDGSAGRQKEKGEIDKWTERKWQVIESGSRVMDMLKESESQRQVKKEKVMDMLKESES